MKASVGLVGVGAEFLALLCADFLDDARGVLLRDRATFRS